MRSDLRAELDEDLTNYPTARDDQAEGQLSEGDATKELDALTKEGSAIIDGLDTFMENFFSKNKLKIDEWKSASRLERVAVRTKPTP